MLVKIVRVIIKEKFDVNLHASGEKTQTLTKAVPLNRPGDFPTPSIWWSNINTKHFGAFAADCSSGQNWAKIGLSQTDEHACFQLGGNLNTAFKSGMLRQFCLDRPVSVIIVVSSFKLFQMKSERIPAVLGQHQASVASQPIDEAWAKSKFWSRGPGC